MAGIFPDELKIANVVPIFKSGDVVVFSNYRPASVSPIFSKLLERLLYNHLIKFINENKLLYDYQFGFQIGKSTQLAVMMLVDKITEAMGKKECAIGKKFKTVDHESLLLKLEKYVIQWRGLEWLNDYLSNRRQYQRTPVLRWTYVYFRRVAENCAILPGFMKNSMKLRNRNIQTTRIHIRKIKTIFHDDFFEDWTGGKWSCPLAKQRAISWCTILVVFMSFLFAPFTSL